MDADRALDRCADRALTEARARGLLPPVTAEADVAELAARVTRLALVHIAARLADLRVGPYHKDRLARAALRHLPNPKAKSRGGATPVRPSAPPDGAAAGLLEESQRVLDGSTPSGEPAPAEVLDELEPARRRRAR